MSKQLPSRDNVWTVFKLQDKSLIISERGKKYTILLIVFFLLTHWGNSQSFNTKFKWNKHEKIRKKKSVQLLLFCNKTAHITVSMAVSNLTAKLCNICIMNH